MPNFMQILLIHVSVFLQQFIMTNANEDFVKFCKSASNCNLRGASLNVSVNHYFPFCDVQRGDRGQLVTKYAVDTELLKMLEKKYNFKSVLLDGRQDWGALVNGKWTGMVQQVKNGTATFAICSISQIVERLQVVDFGIYIFQDDFTFISQKPGLRNSNMVLAQPFGPIVWILLVSAYFTISLVMFGLAVHVVHLKVSLASVHFRLFAIFLNNSTSPIWKESHSLLRLYYGLWLMTVLIISNSYSSSVCSFLTVSQYQRPIDTIDDLYSVATSDHHTLVLKKYSAYWTSIVNAPPENRLYFALAAHIRRTKKEILIEDDTDLVRLVEENENFMMLGTRAALRVFRHWQANKPLHIGSETIAPDYLTLMLPRSTMCRRHSPLLEPFNAIIIRMREMGLVRKWLRNTLDKLPARRNGPNGAGKLSEEESDRLQTISLTRKPLGSVQVKSIFGHWLGGLLLALLALVWEIFHKFIWR